MKKKFFYSFLLLFTVISITAQNNSSPNDVVLKLNGTEMIGRVTEVNEQDIVFIYQHEKLPYHVKISEIYKITFGSGRVEFFNKKPISEHSNLENHHDKVAILPFAYIKNRIKGSDTLSYKIQDELYLFYNKHKKQLQFQDPKTTNVLLIKAGIVNNNLQGITMGEICNILEVEYVLQGTVSIEKVSQNGDKTSGYTIEQNTKKDTNNITTENTYGAVIENIYGTETQKINGSVVSDSNPDYSTSMHLNIYTEKGDSIFSQDHTSFWDNEDAYKITVNYLGRKTPLYKK